MLPPGPKPKPIVGTYNDFQRDRLRFLLQCSREYGDLTYTHFVGRPLYLVNHPDDVQLVLVQHADKFKKLDVGRKGSRSLSNSDGVDWQRRRKLVQPAFHHHRVMDYGAIMTAHAAQLVADWEDGATVDANREMMQVTLGIAAQTLLNTDFSDIADQISRVITAGQEYLDRRGRQPIGAMLQLVRNFDIFQDYLKLKDTIKRLVQQRRAQRADDTGDLLSMLILAQDENGDILSDDDVAGEALGLFIAGHETTANALTWALYLLAQHPDAQTALTHELDSVLSGRLPKANDALPYTEMVIKEAMRLYPPAWVIVRRAAPDVPIRGYTLRQNAIIALSPYTMHRDPRYFPDPDLFDPLRFSPEREKALPRYAYFPFGGGPRICIGNQFAMLEARLVLATVMQRYRVSLMPGQQITPKPLITLRPDGAVLVRLSGR